MIPGASTVFTYVYTATGSGLLGFTATATGQDSFANPLNSSAFGSATITVQSAPVFTSSLVPSEC